MFYREVPLKIDHFPNDDDLKFRISSKMKMLSILRGIADQGTRIALFYGMSERYIPTTLLWVNKHGMWLDVSQFPTENRQLLCSDKITFVSMNQHVKIQFVAHDVENDLFENNEAFFMELPDYLLRIQRRKFSRSSIPFTDFVMCTIPIRPKNPDDQIIIRAASLLDISGGGIGLLCMEDESTLLPNKTFPDCHISLQDAVPLTFTIEVCNSVKFTTPSNMVHKRVGCRFIHPDKKMKTLLLNHINHLQSKI